MSEPEISQTHEGPSPVTEVAGEIVPPRSMPLARSENGTTNGVETVAEVEHGTSTVHAC